MSDEATTTASEPFLTGQAAAERDAGYVPMVDEAKTAEAEELSKAQAADRLNDLRSMANVQTHTVVTGFDENVTMTLEQGAKVVAEARTADREQAELDDDKALQKKVDATRPKPAEPAPDAEPDLEKALAHPKIKEAIERQIGEVETARHAHVTGLAAATQIAESSFFDQFPEFANVPTDQRMAVFAAIAEREPARAESIRASVMRLGDLAAQHGAESQKLAGEHQAKLQSYVKTENDRFEKMVSATSKAERVEIEKGILAKIEEYGGNVDQFVSLMAKSEFSNATVQRLLWDVGKLHKMETRTAAAVRAAPKDIPPVQRPGTTASRGERNVANLGTLDAKFSKSGSLKDAVAFLAAKRGKR
jgi:hypothetical protein